MQNRSENSSFSETDALSNAEWRTYVENYFNSHKGRITDFIKWLLNKGFYREQLASKNTTPENIAEDILQNIFMELLQSNPDARAKIMQAKESAVFNNLVRWAVNSYINESQLKGDSKSGDVYLKPGTNLLPLYDEWGHNAEGLDLKRPKGVTLTSNEDNPYIQLEKKEMAQMVNEALENKLGPQSRKIIKMHFGFSPYDHEYTIDEMAQTLSMDKGHITGQLAKVLKKLRHPLRAKKFITTPL